MVGDLLHGKEVVVFGDSAYMGKMDGAPRAGPDPDERLEQQENQRRREGEKLLISKNKKPGVRAHFTHREENFRLFEGQVQGGLRKALKMPSCSLPSRTYT